jgi:hypothetical protein
MPEDLITLNVHAVKERDLVPYVVTGCIALLIYLGHRESRFLSGLRFGLEAEFVINGIAQSLLAPQITFRGLHADVPEQELRAPCMSSRPRRRSKAMSA